MTEQPSVSFSTWWRDLGTAALLGTARRAATPIPDLGVPGLAVPSGLKPEEALLTSAALGGAARRAGRVMTKATAPEGAPADAHAEAPRRAVQLLELVLTQPPAGAQQRAGLIAHWLRAAADAGYRLPHALLPAMLDTATAQVHLRRTTTRVLDARGTWLAAQRPDWAWAASAHEVPAPGEVTHDDWARLPSADRVAALAVLRGSDPATARSLVASTWATDSAKDRRAHLETLRIGLGPDDESLLERALDDRAPTVREAAIDLLDGLPGSARARRFAARLRPLIEAKGLLRRSLEVTLPDAPDEAAVRDGLGKPPPGRSARGWWLERLAAGTPLEVWTDASGGDPATTVQRLSDDDALRGIRRAARARRDGSWAEALLERSWDPSLVEALPRGARERVVLGRLTSGARTAPETSVLLALPAAPWSADFSRQVVARLRSSKIPAPVVGQAMPHLVSGLHPQSLAALEDWLAHARDDTALATHLRNLLQFHTVKRSISEAFT